MTKDKLHPTVDDFADDSLAIPLFGTHLASMRPALLSAQRHISIGDPAVIAELEDIEARFREAVLREADSLYEQGLLLLPVRLLRLFRARGFSTFGDYCTDTLGIARSTGFWLSDVAAAFTPEQFKELGPSAARVCLMLLRATPEDDGPDDLFTRPLRHGPGAGKAITDATIRELEEEVRFERALAPAPKAVLPPASVDLVERLKAAASEGVKVVARRKPAKKAEEKDAEAWAGSDLQAVRYAIDGLTHTESLVVVQALAEFRESQQR